MFSISSVLLFILRLRFPRSQPISIIACFITIEHCEIFDTQLYIPNFYVSVYPPYHLLSAIQSMRLYEQINSPCPRNTPETNSVRGESPCKQRQIMLRLYGIAKVRSNWCVLLRQSFHQRINNWDLFRDPWSTIEIEPKQTCLSQLHCKTLEKRKS